MHEGDNPSFLNEFMKFYFIFDNCIHIRIFKQIPKYLATGLVILPTPQRGVLLYNTTNPPERPLILLTTYIHPNKS